MSTGSQQVEKEFVVKRNSQTKQSNETVKRNSQTKQSNKSGRFEVRRDNASCVQLQHGITQRDLY